MAVVSRRIKAPDPSPSCVIGIDQSYSGFAIVVLYEDLDHRVMRKGFSSTAYGQGVDRLGSIEDWFVGVLAVFDGVQHVGMEGYSYGARNGREQAGELGYAVKRVLRARFGEPIGYPTIVSPTQVKKYATSNGAAKKDLMIKSVFTKWGFDTSDDNEADAYVVARIAHALAYGGEPTKYESEVLTKLERHTEWQRA